MTDTVLQVRVVTPEKPVYEGEASLVIVPAHDGEVGIQARHVRFLASLGFGTLRVHTGGKVLVWFLEGGFVQVGGNKVTVLCDHATPIVDLDPAQADRLAAEAAAAHQPQARHLAQRATVMKRVRASRHAGSGAPRP
jgi:F-type H+-transporting ATPase subunit epsilon